MIFFNKTYRYKSPLSADAIKSKLIGQHFKVHNLDFEVYDKEDKVKIIPHAEQEDDIKTLPITSIDIKGNGSGSDITLKSKMRRLDSGFPTLVMIFVTFLLMAALLLYMFGGEGYEMQTYIIAGIGVLIFLYLWIKLQSGYFDYIRKIRDHVKKQIA